MKKIFRVFALIFFVLSANTVFSQVGSTEKSKDIQYAPEQQFAREEAQRDQQRAALEIEKANAELEELRLEAEGIMATDAALAQKETDAMSQELASELLILYDQADKEAQAREKELKKEDARNRKQAFDVIEQITQELDRNLKRIRLRPPRP